MFTLCTRNRGLSEEHRHIPLWTLVNTVSLQVEHLGYAGATEIHVQQSHLVKWDLLHAYCMNTHIHTAWMHTPTNTPTLHEYAHTYNTHICTHTHTHTQHECVHTHTLWMNVYTHTRMPAYTVIDMCEQVLFVRFYNNPAPVIRSMQFHYCTVSNPGTGADDAFVLKRGM